MIKRLFFRQLGYLALTCVGAVFAFWLLLIAAPKALNPLCTYEFNVKIDATIEVGGEEYHSTAVYRDSRTREWTTGIIATECIQKDGGALVFQLNSGAVVLVPIGLCYAAKRSLRSSRTTDVKADCDGQLRTDGDAYAVDSGTTPELWKQLTWGEEVRLVSMQAKRSFASPSDLLDERAPGILDARFTYQNWGRSPERVVPFKRRHDEAEAFRFQVEQGQFDLVQPN